MVKFICSTGTTRWEIICVVSNFLQGRNSGTLPMMRPERLCFPVPEVFRQLTAIIFIRVDHTATCTVLTLTFTSRFGIKTSGRILVVIPETIHQVNQRDRVDLVVMDISRYG